MNKMQNELLGKLKEKVDKLHYFLSEPEEGLFTWNETVAVLWQEIAELWEPDNYLKKIVKKQ